MLGNYLQQTSSTDDIFRYFFFLGALRVNKGLKKIRNVIIQLIYVIFGTRSGKLKELGSNVSSYNLQ